MNREGIKINRTLLGGIYGYLMLPMILFLIGWCKWYISVPAIAILCISFRLCLKEHLRDERPSRPKSPEETSENWFTKRSRGKCCVILVIVLCWVALSGIGGYVWQNDDHLCRNTIFNLLVENAWPVKDTISINGILQERGLVYYIGFWLPAALIGKMFGLNAGYAAQYLWAVAGILLFYALICTWRREIVVWPLWIIIFFSGTDVIGTLLNYEDGLQQLLGSVHLERWAQHYQFSSMTTQLFWVFNQAIPAWLASAMIFMAEKPKNLIFTWSLLMLTSTLPFAGLLPFIFYFLIFRGIWEKSESVPRLIGNAWKNWSSLQNILGGGVVGFVNLFYLMGNVSVGNSPVFQSLFSSVISAKHLPILLAALVLLLAMAWGCVSLILHKKGRYMSTVAKYALPVCILCGACYVLSRSYQSGTYIYQLLFLFSFYLVEVGIYLICLKKQVKNQNLFWLTASWLLVIPRIVIGNSQDFCMRASIPALILIMLWCIDAMAAKKRTVMTWVLIGVFLVGSITPLHEIKRTYVNTRDGFEIRNADIYEILSPGNFSGSLDGVFWERIAK